MLLEPSLFLFFFLVLFSSGFFLVSTFFLFGLFVAFLFALAFGTAARVSHSVLAPALERMVAKALVRVYGLSPPSPAMNHRLLLLRYGRKRSFKEVNPTASHLRPRLGESAWRTKLHFARTTLHFARTAWKASSRRAAGLLMPALGKRIPARAAVVPPETGRASARALAPYRPISCCPRRLQDFLPK